jgi:nucleotide-binding universal stress UspA family protein
MLRSIVVPLDGSRFAERALPIASRLAKASDATLHLVMAQDPTQGLAPFAELGPPSVLLMEELDRRHTAYLERTAVRLRKAGRIRVNVVHADGAAGRVIARTVKSARAGLVVMSTHGRGALGRVGLGSVADYVVRHLEIPILLIPSKGILPRGIPARRVLIPLDLSPESGTVLDAIEDLVGTSRGTRLTVLHVVEPVPVVSLPTMPYPINADGQLAELQWEQARKRLAEFEVLARRRGFLVSARLVAGPRAGAVILDQLHGSGVDLVAMTTHGYSGFKRLLLGSVTNKVIRNARKPVLVLRPKRGSGRARKAGRRAAAKE